MCRFFAHPNRKAEIRNRDWGVSMLMPTQTLVMVEGFQRCDIWEWGGIWGGRLFGQVESRAGLRDQTAMCKAEMGPEKDEK